MNGTNDSNDPGQDGIGTSRVGSDAFAFALGYYQGDYQGIGATPSSNGLWDRLDEQQGHRGLYNGNISWMQTNLPGLKQQGINPQQAMLYEYDQLNRLVQAQSLRNFSETSGFATRTANPEAFDANYSYDANGNLLTLQRFDLQGQLQDDFVYQYQAESNRLASVSDAVPAQTITYDTKVYDQGPIQSDGKVYRQITVEGSAEVPSGQSAMLQANELIHLKQNFHAKAGSGFHAKWTNEATAASETLDDNSTFTYDAIGNLISDSGEGTSIEWTPYGKVRSVSHSDGTVVNYRYDATGNRVEKSVVSNDSSYTTRYIRDASGNVLAIYQNDSLAEQPIYGSSRLGVYAGKTVAGEQQLGHRKYELNSHLGTIHTVITDNANLTADSAWATIVSTQDVFPFGLEMNGRSWQSESYAWGFNGKMRDNSFGGSNATVFDYGFRIYKPSIGKFLSVDPLMASFPWLTPYQFASNRPIIAVDLDGLESDDQSGQIVEPNVKKPNEAFQLAPAIPALEKATEEAVKRNILRGVGWFFTLMSLGGDTPIQGPDDWEKQELEYYDARVRSGEALHPHELKRYVELLRKHRGVSLTEEDFKHPDLFKIGPEEPKGMLGKNGPITPSKTIWRQRDTKHTRIDVENPNPGQRSGQIHYQDENNTKYMYNAEEDRFFGKNKSTGKYDVPVPKIDKLLEKPEIRRAIDKGKRMLDGQ